MEKRIADIEASVDRILSTINRMNIGYALRRQYPLVAAPDLEMEALLRKIKKEG